MNNVNKQANNAAIVLEDGSIYPGVGFGATGATVGEVVFTTAMTGYQEVLTDPSYHRQIIASTVTQVGNVGVNEQDPESNRVWAAGFAVRQLSPCTSNWRATHTLDAYLREQNVIGIAEVETRALVRHLRTRGVMRGVIAHGEAALYPEVLLKMAQDWVGMDGLDLVPEVTCAEPYHWTQPNDPRWYDAARKPHLALEAPHIIAYDYGIKRNILRLFTDRGMRVTVVPAQTSAADVLAQKPDGVFLSNGPGDPAAATYAIDAVRDLAGKVPMFGICLGHQIMGLALGGKTHKMKFGHRGSNQPVIDTQNEAVSITVHNHGFAVTPGTLPADTVVTRLNLNDGVIEGLACEPLKMFSVQYHPEAAPGPHDALNLFDQFVDLVAHEHATP